MTINYCSDYKTELSIPVYYVKSDFDILSEEEKEKNILETSRPAGKEKHMNIMTDWHQLSKETYLQDIIDSGETIYIWSDLHLDHKNVIQYCHRPFSSVEEMNIHFLDEMKKLENKRSHLLFVGDISFNDKMKDSFNSINVKNILVLGNHDVERTHIRGFDIDVKLMSTSFIFDNSHYFVSHYPVSDHFLDKHGFDYNIHGHIHDQKLMPKKLIYIKDKPYYIAEERVSARHINVSVENTDYKPFKLQEFLLDMKKSRFSKKP